MLTLNSVMLERWIDGWTDTYISSYKYTVKFMKKKNAAHVLVDPRCLVVGVGNTISDHVIK